MVIVVIAAAMVLSYLRTPRSNGPDAGGWYEARPVYGVIGSGFYMQIPSRQPATLPGGTGVMLEVAFRNQGRSQFSTKPGDFQVLQPTGGLLLPDFTIAACPNWQQIQVSPGTMTRPVTLCFPHQSATQALTLLWQPDVAPAVLGTVSRAELPALPG